MVANSVQVLRIDHRKRLKERKEGEQDFGAMRWTVENDQLLFLKLIDSHEVSVKPQKIQDGREVPTARAISERIVKLRSAVRTAPAGATSSSPRSTQTTPRRRKNVQDNGKKSPSGSNVHLLGDASKEQGPVRKRKRRLDTTSPAVVKEGLEGGSSASVPLGFGIFGAEGWGDEPSRRAGTEEHNLEGEEEEGKRKEGTN
ncbi:hypothetical protein B9Z19DRAFT_1068736 [Tuber borchii]|uniref:Uncharacterized protein n=1 Tax=Tuber borchii TaxID=42251 RepID=A0A2T6ZE08_TUBBO|nr:hypothetical protein B9Z19DRAFT_1068736 [Tuber borchii]